MKITRASLYYNDDLESVVLLDDYKNSLKVNIEAERVLFEATNKVPNGVFWALTYYNFTKGTDQTTWMLYNNKWQGWLECAQAREAAVANLGV
jgi:hypothetical protein